jgi:hypothetical protein
METRKYRLTEETMEWCGHTLHRIEALKDFGDVKAGDRGGFIESEKNLSQDGDAWVYRDVSYIREARVYREACVYGEACVSGSDRVYRETDYIVFKNWWSSGRCFTWTRSNNMWKVGCFYGTGEELIKKAYADSEKSGREYERVVKYVESILADEKNEVLKNNR